MTNTQFYTPKEAALILGYTNVASIYRHINEGNITAKKIGPRRYVISIDAIEKFKSKWNDE